MKQRPRSGSWRPPAEPGEDLVPASGHLKESQAGCCLVHSSALPGAGCPCLGTSNPSYSGKTWEGRPLRTSTAMAAHLSWVPVYAGRCAHRRLELCPFINEKCIAQRDRTLA